MGTNMNPLQQDLYALTTTFKSLVVKDQFFTIHEKKLQYLTHEAFKVRMGLSPVIMKKIFKNLVYKLRSGNHLWRTFIFTACICSESMANLGAKIWNLIPGKIKASNIVDIRSKHSEVFVGKVVLKICFASLLKSHFGMGVLL